MKAHTMVGVQRTIILSLLCIFVVSTVSAADYYDKNNIAQVSLGTFNQCHFIVMQNVGGSTVDITGAQTYPGDNPVRALLYNGTQLGTGTTCTVAGQNPISNTTVVNNNATFPQTLTVANGSFYTIMFDNSSSTWVMWWSSGSLPVTGSTGKMVYNGSGSGGGGEETALRDLTGVYFTDHATPFTNFSISISDSRSSTSIAGFTWSYVTDNSSDAGTKTGYCAATSCSLTNFTGTLNVTVTNVSGHLNPYDSPKLSIVYNTTSTSYTFNAINTSMSVQLNVRSFYSDKNYSKNFTLGVLNANQSYNIGLLMAKSNVTRHRYVVIFNSTVLDDSTDASTSVGYPFRTNAACTDAASTCIASIAYGGGAVWNDSWYPKNATKTLNGTIDEVVTGYYSGYPGNDLLQAFSAPYLLGLGAAPTMAFSSTYVANLYTPVLGSFAYAPSNPTFVDNINASGLFSDLDFETPSNVTFQWRVNGSTVYTITVNVSNGTDAYVSSLLNKGNFTQTAVVNVTAWATDGVYTSVNQSFQFVIGGITPDPVTALSCAGINKTQINCNWTNPLTNLSNISVYKNNSLFTSLSNLTTSYNFTGLLPDTTLNLSFETVSFDGTLGNRTSNISSTTHNLPPVITSYSPSNLTPTLAENTTQVFSVNATNEDENPIIAWFKDNVFQLLGNIFTWNIGLNEQGQHNVTAVANDSYGATNSTTWIATVTDDFPSPNPPVFSPNGGFFRTYIPLSCPSTNAYSAVDHYEISVSVNGTAYENVSTQNRYAALDFDITQYPYLTNFTFNCTAIGAAGNASSISNIFTRDFVNEFYSTTTNGDMRFQSLNPYVMSLYYDAQNPNNNVFVQYAYADCNGDGIYDYVYNYTAYNPSRIKTYYQCVFPKGIVNYEIGVFIQKNTSTTWQGSGCSPSYDYSDTCLVKKQYQLQVT